MIRLEQPSIAVNDLRWAAAGKYPVRFHMWRTWDLPKIPARRGTIVSYVAALARQAPGAQVKNLVISCHGAPGYLLLGEGFGQHDVGLFFDWYGLFDVIWLKGCNVSRDSGQGFCANMAVATGARVVASTELQITGPRVLPPTDLQAMTPATFPYGCID